jgi:hypothetical protein
MVFHIQSRTQTGSIASQVVGKDNGTHARLAGMGFAHEQDLLLGHFDETKRELSLKLREYGSNGWSVFTIVLNRSINTRVLWCYARNEHC